MPQNNPKVTLLIPVFNESKGVLEKSFSSIMEQTFSDFDCIVVDESTDSKSAKACEEICKRDPRFHYIHPPERLGLPGSLNLAISMARGELLARFDSDDICLPERLSAQVAFMDANIDVGVLGGCIQLIDENGNLGTIRQYPEHFEDIIRKIHFTNAMAHPTVMYRADIIKKHGTYDVSYRFAEDLDLWLRWLNRGVVFANLPQVLVQYRQNHTHRHRNNWKFNLRARINNFTFHFLFQRVFGIILISAWSILPVAVQEKFFRLIVFRTLR